MPHDIQFTGLSKTMFSSVSCSYNNLLYLCAHCIAIGIALVKISEALANNITWILWLVN